MKPLSILKGVAAGLFVLSLPVLFGTLTLRWMVSDTGWYRSNFAKNGVSERTGIPPEELARAATEMSSYLLLKRSDIDIPVKIRGQMAPLFNDRELRHMADVQALLRGFYALQAAAGSYALIYLVASRLQNRTGYWRGLGAKLRWGGSITVGLFGLFGLLSLLDFDKLFLQFHLVSFDNDLWMLDPTKDNLVMMVPQPFWYDSAIRLAQVTGVQALMAILIGSFLTKRSNPEPRLIVGGTGAKATK